MPALKGSLTYTRFYVDGDLPDDHVDTFFDAIQHWAMRPLEPDEDLSERTGWTRMGEPFEVELDYESVFVDHYINLTMRTDKWVIPTPMLRAKLREAEAALLARKGRERLSRKERMELKEVVSRKLRRQLAPTTRAVDLSWSLEEKVVRFFSQTTASVSLMEEMFTKTFGLKLVRESPYTLAARLGLTDAQERAWEALDATSLLTAENAL
jgi:recombination associated protein RdgC